MDDDYAAALYLLLLIKKQKKKRLWSRDWLKKRTVTAAERLSVTLRYLATGESYRSLSCQFRISHNLISSIIPTVCKAIYQVLQPLHVKLPSTTEEWQKVADFIDREDISMGRLNRGQMHQHASAGVEELHAIGRGHSNQAKQVREQFREYFNNEGQVHWQDRMAPLN
ncbi:hypothetical protein Pcinc_012293 [Petrolisthes cinctipes]|uniref:Transposase Helix-turn-helix domain-containing protein n=1 Tax=Petrolisthes cinctipes TaxID=88211 RepID=A0AAE1FZ75_PETCI|nr:hypothetical protein Pcinc_012293 [Petrolisthes cinctipes]